MSDTTTSQGGSFSRRSGLRKGIRKGSSNSAREDFRKSSNLDVNKISSDTQKQANVEPITKTEETNEQKEPFSRKTVRKTNGRLGAHNSSRADFRSRKNTFDSETDASLNPPNEEEKESAKVEANVQEPEGGAFARRTMKKSIRPNNNSNRANFRSRKSMIDNPIDIEPEEEKESVQIEISQEDSFIHSNGDKIDTPKNEFTSTEQSSPQSTSPSSTSSIMDAPIPVLTEYDLVTTEESASLSSTSSIVDTPVPVLTEDDLMTTEQSSSQNSASSIIHESIPVLTKDDYVATEESVSLSSTSIIMDTPVPVLTEDDLIITEQSASNDSVSSIMDTPIPVLTEDDLMAAEESGSLSSTRSIVDAPVPVLIEEDHMTTEQSESQNSASSIMDASISVLTEESASLSSTSSIMDTSVPALTENDLSPPVPVITEDDLMVTEQSASQSSTTSIVDASIPVLNENDLMPSEESYSQSPARPVMDMLPAVTEDDLMTGEENTQSSTSLPPVPDGIMSTNESISQSPASPMMDTAIPGFIEDDLITTEESVSQDSTSSMVDMSMPVLSENDLMTTEESVSQSPASPVIANNEPFQIEKHAPELTEDGSITIKESLSQSPAFNAPISKTAAEDESFTTKESGSTTLIVDMPVPAPIEKNISHNPANLIVETSVPLVTKEELIPTESDSIKPEEFSMKKGAFSRKTMKKSNRATDNSNRATFRSRKTVLDSETDKSENNPITEAPDKEKEGLRLESNRETDSNIDIDSSQVEVSSQRPASLIMDTPVPVPTEDEPIPTKESEGPILDASIPIVIADGPIPSDTINSDETAQSAESEDTTEDFSIKQDAFSRRTMKKSGRLANTSNRTNFRSRKSFKNETDDSEGNSATQEPEEKNQESLPIDSNKEGAELKVGEKESISQSSTSQMLDTPVPKAPQNELISIEESVSQSVSSPTLETSVPTTITDEPTPTELNVELTFIDQNTDNLFRSTESNNESEDKSLTTEENNEALQLPGVQSLTAENNDKKFLDVFEKNDKFSSRKGMRKTINTENSSTRKKSSDVPASEGDSQASAGEDPATTPKRVTRRRGNTENSNRTNFRLRKSVVVDDSDTTWQNEGLVAEEKKQEEQEEQEPSKPKTPLFRTIRTTQSATTNLINLGSSLGNESSLEEPIYVEFPDENKDILSSRKSIRKRTTLEDQLSSGAKLDITVKDDSESEFVSSPPKNRLLRCESIKGKSEEQGKEKKDTLSFQRVGIKHHSTTSLDVLNGQPGNGEFANKDKQGQFQERERPQSPQFKRVAIRKPHRNSLDDFSSMHAMKEKEESTKNKNLKIKRNKVNPSAPRKGFASQKMFEHPSSSRQERSISISIDELTAYDGEETSEEEMDMMNAYKSSLGDFISHSPLTKRQSKKKVAPKISCEKQFDETDDYNSLIDEYLRQCSQPTPSSPKKKNDPIEMDNLMGNTRKPGNAKNPLSREKSNSLPGSSSTSSSFNKQSRTLRKPKNDKGTGKKELRLSINKKNFRIAGEKEDEAEPSEEETDSMLKAEDEARVEKEESWSEFFARVLPCASCFAYSSVSDDDPEEEASVEKHRKLIL